MVSVDDDVERERRGEWRRGKGVSNCLEGGPGGLPLRASNEGLLRPRVARAQKTTQTTSRFLSPLQGEYPDCSLLRASRNHQASN